MGVLMEALMKERIMLKLGVDYHKSYGLCLKLIKDKKLMEVKDIFFLRKFKDEVRNPYLHADDFQVLQGILTPVWKLQFKNLDIKKLQQFQEDIRSGKAKPVLLPAAYFPEFRAIQKQSYDRERAITLFNQTYDFLRDAYIKYFKQEEYDEYQKRFGSRLSALPAYKL